MPPHLAGLGIGNIQNGVITDSYGITVIATLHLIFSAVLGAGGLLHSVNFLEILEIILKIVNQEVLILNGMIQIS